MLIENDDLPATPNSTCSSEEIEHDSVEEQDPEVYEVAAPEIAELEELIAHSEDYAPTVPDALTDNYLKCAGLTTTDPRIVRIISLAAQKFIADISNDALQHCKTRTTNSQHASSHGSNKDKKKITDRKYTLAMEDLTPALADHGITMRKPQYFV